MSTRGLFEPQHRRGSSGLLDAGDVLDSWPSGHTLPWGNGFSLSSQTVWVNDNAAGGGTGLNEEFTVDGTLTGNNFTPNFGGTWPGDMVYNSDTEMFWQVNVGGDNCIHEWDPTIPGATGNSICGPGWTDTSQRGLAYNPNAETYFIGGWNDAIIYEIDASGDTVSSCTMNLGVSGLAYNAQEELLFAMTNAAINTLEVIDWATCSVVDSITVADDAFPSFSGAGLAIDCEGNLWAANQVDQNVYLIDSGVPTNLCVGYGIEIDPDSASDSADPGQSAVYTLEITNTGTVTDTFDLSLSGETWDSELSTASVTLDADESTNVTVTVDVPPGALGGDFDTVTAAAMSTEDPLGETEASSVLTTTANILYGVEMAPATASAVADPGQQVVFSLEVTNTGNATDTFDLSLSGQSWTSELSTTSVTVDADESEMITVTVSIPAGATDGASDLVMVTAESTGDPLGETDATSVLTTGVSSLFKDRFETGM